MEAQENPDQFLARYRADLSTTLAKLLAPDSTLLRHLRSDPTKLDDCAIRVNSLVAYGEADEVDRIADARMEEAYERLLAITSGDAAVEALERLIRATTH
eukprot:7098930-Prymnesium_polylepis.1